MAPLALADPPTRRVSASSSASIAYEVHGDGIPLLALHGAYSSRREVRGFLEPMLEDRAIRRIYADLPGHGESRPSSDVASPDAVLDLLDLVLQAEAETGSFLLLGHSYGGHLARALAARHPSRTAGVAVLCPVIPGPWDTAAAGSVVRDDGVGADLDEREREEFEGYFVVRTADTLDRFRRDVVPATGEVDDDTLERAIGAGPHAIDPDRVVITAPVLIVAARQDRYVGWHRQQRLADRCPHATVATVADAGHALPHERPALVAALLADWLDRAGI
ncbi:alpha/beta hydrolase [Microbacterium sp. 4R-513]|uniref:alpha/beta fold hydrolase n=1 Tax=Microbacterium sp. 4R-513 TaxID=2567934 RepID=UPI0013E13E54|nr:alpha/beta hydrolase [Microbacterium sp. 4R-513]QIG38208.1 alpha/beta hydrolase [Microbacterium sp. 4R-513]